MCSVGSPSCCVWLHTDPLPWLHLMPFKVWLRLANQNRQFADSKASLWKSICSMPVHAHVDRRLSQRILRTFKEAIVHQFIQPTSHSLPTVVPNPPTSRRHQRAESQDSSPTATQTSNTERGIKDARLQENNRKDNMVWGCCRWLLSLDEKLDSVWRGLHMQVDAQSSILRPVTGDLAERYF